MSRAFPAFEQPGFSGSTLARALHGLAVQLAGVRASTDAFRLLSADSEPLPGVQIECYAGWAVAGFYGAGAWQCRDQVAGALGELGAVGVYVKRHERTDLRRLATSDLAPAEPHSGEPSPEQVVIRESGRRYAVRLGDGLSTGLFLDQRSNRDYLQQSCNGARVLNLFAYTCSFSVAAGLGGAANVTSVDFSGAVLRRGAHNLELNGLRGGRQRVLRADVLKWLPRALKRPERFDWIVLDPPSFSSMGKRTFSVERDYEAVAAQCCQLLCPGGRLLAVTNHRQTSRSRFRQIVTEAAAAARREVSQLLELEPTPDCIEAGDAGATKSILVRCR